MKNYKTYITEKKKDLTSQWWEAVILLDLDRIKKLIDKVDINDTFTVEEFTALILACEKNYYEVAEFLINNGADLNKQNIYGYTALMSTSYPEIAELLIKAGADMTLTNDVDDTFIERSTSPIVGGSMKEWLNTEESQRLILSKNPLLYKIFKKAKIRLKPNIKKEFAFAKTGEDLNLL